MFKKLKSLFFIEEDPKELEVEVSDSVAEEIQKVVEPVVQDETIVIQDLKKVEPEKSVMVTLTPSVKQRIEERKQSQPSYEFETILSPYSGRTNKKAESKPVAKPAAVKKETRSFSNVISPMYGQTKKQSKPVAYEEVEVEEEITLDDLIGNKTNSEPELVQFTLFEGEKE